MKTPTQKVLIGVAIVFILWVFYVAYERANYEAKLNAPVIPPIHNPIEVFPSNACPQGVNCLES